MRKEEKQEVKDELKNLITLTKNRDKKLRKKVEIPWFLKIVLLTFIISLVFSSLSETILPNVNTIIGIIIVIIFILIGIMFDIIGVAMTSCDLIPFNSMASRKVYGAKLSVKLIKNADKVSSFCCDVIGDICGIISGTASTIVASNIASILNINIFFVSLIITALVASLTIGGKAIGKSFAINKNNIIVFEFAKFLNKFYKVK